MKRILYLIICLLFAWPCYATTDTLEGETVTNANTIEGVSTTNTVEGQVLKSSASCDIANIIFWWRCEAADFSATNDDTAPCTGAAADGADCSIADDTATGASAGEAINADASKFVAGNGMDLPSTFDYYGFTGPSTTLDDETRIGFWMRLTTFTDTRRLVYISGDGDNQIFISLDGSDELQLIWKDSATTRTNVETTDANIATGTWYFVEAAWKSSAPYRRIYVNGVLRGEETSAMASFGVAVANTYFGDGTGTAQDTHLDNIIISTDSTQDLHTVCKDEEEYPN